VQAGASREELIALRAELKLDRELKNLRQAIAGTSEGAERVRDIVEDLRRLSADGSGEFTAFDLAATTRIAADWVSRGMKRPVRLVIDAPGQVMARGRPGHVQQVVMNLVQNAIDALKATADPAIAITLGAERDRVFVEVADNGPGIPPETAAAIFDPFFTTKPVGDGTGLGLAISHKIAEEHGGTLKLLPSETGAQFRLDLPGAAP
jgi:two-component system sensor histidine kinase HupT/HoxJ